METGGEPATEPLTRAASAEAQSAVTRGISWNDETAAKAERIRHETTC